MSKKAVFFGTLSQTMGRWGSKVLIFLVKTTIQLFLLQTRFLGLCPKIGVAVGGWGSRVPNKYMEFCPKNISFFQQKKNKNALNSPKSKINLTFISHLVEFQTCAVGGWGPMFGTKSRINLFFDTFPKRCTDC